MGLFDLPIPNPLDVVEEVARETEKGVRGAAKLGTNVAKEAVNTGTQVTKAVVDTGTEVAKGTTKFVEENAEEVVDIGLTVAEIAVETGAVDGLLGGG